HVAGIFQAPRDLAWSVDAADVLADEIAFLGFIFEKGGRRQVAVLHVTGKFDRVENLLITGAAADVSAQAFLDFLAVGEWICPARRRGSHHHAGDAIAALAPPPPLGRS